MLLHLVHVPGAPNSGLDARAQFRIGREKLYTMTFADFEARIRDDLDRMLGAGGFVSARDIAADHGEPLAAWLQHVANSLFDPDDYEDRVLKLARQRAGNVAIANTDAGGDAWVHYAPSIRRDRARAEAHVVERAVSADRRGTSGIARADCGLTNMATISRMCGAQLLLQLGDALLDLRRRQPVGEFEAQRQHDLVGRPDARSAFRSRARRRPAFARSP